MSRRTAASMLREMRWTDAGLRLPAEGVASRCMCIDSGASEGADAYADPGLEAGPSAAAGAGSDLVEGSYMSSIAEADPLADPLVDPLVDPNATAYTTAEAFATADSDLYSASKAEADPDIGEEDGLGAEAD